MIPRTEVEFEGRPETKVLLSSDETNKNNEQFYVRYRGNTYEISKFLKNHPGGSNAFKAYRGLTLDKILEDVPHSKAAYHLFNEFELNNKRAYDEVEVNNTYNNNNN